MSSLEFASNIESSSRLRIVLEGDTVLGAVYPFWEFSVACHLGAELHTPNSRLHAKVLGAKFHSTYSAISDQLDKANIFVP